MFNRNKNHLHSIRPNQLLRSPLTNAQTFIITYLIGIETGLFQTYQTQSNTTIIIGSNCKEI